MVPFAVPWSKSDLLFLVYQPNPQLSRTGSLNILIPLNATLKDNNNNSKQTNKESKHTACAKHCRLGYSRKASTNASSAETKASSERTRGAHRHQRRPIRGSPPQVARSNAQSHDSHFPLDATPRLALPLITSSFVPSPRAAQKPSIPLHPSRPSVRTHKSPPHPPSPSVDQTRFNHHHQTLSTTVPLFFPPFSRSLVAKKDQQTQRTCARL